MKKSVEELLQCPYWIIDILPSQVPEDSPGQYFAVEKYCLQSEQIEAINESMILSEPDDTHLTVFNPDAQLLELIRQIASGEGLFVWKPNSFNRMEE